MTYYSVLAVTPTREDWIPDYIGSANALVARHGGKYLARTASHERLECEGEDVALRIIIEWPSKEAPWPSSTMRPVDPISRLGPPGRTATTC